MELNNENFEKEILKSHKPSMVNFWASWSGPCRMVNPIVKELSLELNNINIKSIDVDDNPESARKYEIRNAPTLLFFEKGEVVDKIVGGAPKPHKNRDSNKPKGII